MASADVEDRSSGLEEAVGNGDAVSDAENRPRNGNAKSSLGDGNQMKTNHTKEKDESGEEGEASDEGEVEGNNCKGEREDGELEEGEVDDDEDKTGSDGKEKTSVCKYFFKGQCTWGSHCRFIHPGSADKGNYNMFDSAPAAKAAIAQEAAIQIKPISSGPLMVPQPQRMPIRRNSPQLVPPGMALRLPLPPMGLPGPPLGLPDFFPPLPEPRRETMWERGLRTAKNLAKAAARKRDAIEDKMHGLSEKFDPDFEDENYGGENDVGMKEQQQNFGSFPMRHEMEGLRDRRMNNEFNRFDRRRGSPAGLDMSAARHNMREPMRQRPSHMQQQMRPRDRPADEWQDPWMRRPGPAQAAGGGGIRNHQRWNQLRRDRSNSKSRSISRSPSQDKKSHTSRISSLAAASYSRSVSREKEKASGKRRRSQSLSQSSASSLDQPRQRRTNTAVRAPKSKNKPRAPSASPISSSRTSPSRSPSASRSRSRSSSADEAENKPRQPNKKKKKVEPHTPPSSPESEKGRRNGRPSPKSPITPTQQRKERNKAGGAEEKSPSLSSVSSRSDQQADRESSGEGPRTPPPEPEEPDRPGPGHRSPSPEEAQIEASDRSRSKRRSTGSPISEDDEMEGEDGGFGRQQSAGGRKLKKGHKPIKLTMQAKLERPMTGAMAAFGMSEDEEEKERAMQPDASIRPRRQTSVTTSEQRERERQDASSPLSEQEEAEQEREDVSTPREKTLNMGGLDDKANKREELLRQLRAVEEAIARKKASKAE